MPQFCHTELWTPPTGGVCGYCCGASLWARDKLVYDTVPSISPAGARGANRTRMIATVTTAPPPRMANPHRRDEDAPDRFRDSATRDEALVMLKSPGLVKLAGCAAL